MVFKHQDLIKLTFHIHMDMRKKQQLKIQMRNSTNSRNIRMNNSLMDLTQSLLDSIMDLSRNNLPIKCKPLLMKPDQ